MKAKFIPWSISGAMLIAGCGGGGDDGGLGNATPPAADPVEITSANAKTVASSAMLSALEGGNFASFVDVDTAELDSTSPTKTRTTPLYSKVAAAQAERDAELAKPSGTLWSQAATGPTMTPCDAGGSMTVSSDFASETAITPGDELTLVFDQCDDGSALIDGTFSMTVVSFSGSLDTGQYLLSVTVELASLSIAEAGDTVASDGDVTMTIDTTSSPTLAITLTSDSLTVEAEGKSQSLSEYLLTESIDSVTGDYSIEASGSLSSDAFEGIATFETVEPFVGLAGQHPYLGELLISGANGATIRAIALDAQFVRLEVDTDGDGTADFSEDYSWEELTA